MLITEKKAKPQKKKEVHYLFLICFYIKLSSDESKKSQNGNV